MNKVYIDGEIFNWTPTLLFGERWKVNGYKAKQYKDDIRSKYFFHDLTFPIHFEDLRKRAIGTSVMKVICLPKYDMFITNKMYICQN